MAIKLDKHLPDKSNEKSLTIWKLALWIIIVIVLALSIPKAIQYIRQSIHNAARSKAEKAYTLYLVENAASIDDYTLFVVHHNNHYYVFWYVDEIKALAGYDDTRGYKPPLVFPKGTEYPLTHDPFAIEYKLGDYGNWNVAASCNSEYGYMSTFENEESCVTYTYCDKQSWGVEIYVMYVNNETIKAKCDKQSWKGSAGSSEYDFV